MANKKPASRSNSDTCAINRRGSFAATRKRLAAGLPPLASPATKALALPNVKIGEANDRYEQEADRMADRVMRMSDPDARQSGNSEADIQQHCAGCEEEATARNETEGLVQAKSAPVYQSGRESGPVSRFRRLKGGGRALDSSTRAFMEPRFEQDFSRVRIHDDNRASDLAKSIDARAFTLGRDVVFAAGEYTPGSYSGRRLLAHELTHVVQQAQTSLPTPSAFCTPAETPEIQRQVSDERRFQLIAAHVHDGIYGPGTDEELVYQALQELNRDDNAIREFKKAYRAYVAEAEDEPIDELSKNLLIEDIEEDFSGSELEYALLLINERTEDGELRIDSESPQSESAIDAAAGRLWRALEPMDTDEEAVYAVLLPFDRNQEKLRPLREAYRRHSGGIELETSILSEMSGEELEYAIFLSFDPRGAYRHYLREASAELSVWTFGGARMVGESCQARAGESFDPDNWEKEIEHEATEEEPWGQKCGMLLRQGKRPSEAIEELIDDFNDLNLSQNVDCAEWVQLHHLYAALKLLGPFRFDLRFDGLNFWLNEFRSSGLSTKRLFVREGGDRPERRSNEIVYEVRQARGGAEVDPRNMEWYRLDKEKPRNTDDVLRDAPVGSRIMWANLYLRLNDATNSMVQENAIKLGDDLYGAHGFFPRKTFTRMELELAMAAEGGPPGFNTEATAKKYVFIQEIEYYTTLADEPWKPIAR